MKKELAIITGATSGIGRGLTITLTARGITVLAIGRNTEKLAELTKLPDSIRIVPYKCDITREIDIVTVVDRVRAFNDTHELKYLVHNATVLDPIKPLTDVTAKELNMQIDVNVTGPMLLTNKLLQYFKKEARILFISTGASRTAITNVVPHCAAKAAQAILAKGYKDELKNREILAGIVEPGITDTPAQAYVRSLSSDVLPFADIARKIYNEDGLSTSADCAKLLSTLLCDVEKNKFSDIWPWQLTNKEHLEYLK
ncbi:MAG: hypothetical protein A3E87_10690 [Gammaproteobacteria bacterium RIFCSPHIGHO2_12_FULL_35_23]|nr:MAG: hypothetical protein A3E87_10690 [Gammaproteobacteria bacterium RIFCSPHIGHO2_12_FULL_35_23]